MLALKYLLEILGFALLAAAATVALSDLSMLHRQSSLILNNEPCPVAVRPRWLAVGRLCALALVSLVAGLSIQALD